MKRIYTLLIFTFTVLTNIYSQKGTIKIAKAEVTDSSTTPRTYFHPIQTSSYLYQGTNNFHYSFGMGYFRLKTLSRIGLSGGFVLFSSKKITYLSPTLIIDGFYRLKSKNKKYFGPFCKIGFSHYKILGETDNIISTDLGFKIFNISIFGGYNFNLDSRDLTGITKYRLGIGIGL